ncbi:class I SAM-dependent methyltransferase [Methylosinus sp. Sm6]|uniref:class I SAM-dependent methyltransferase n=1 Tax=Methylosinus sp. Sm6 TaxID=2866948 RepID=UPI001C98F56D|nr:class I SAM-dependent methyltransferase [Methylosinus sp. Sm6]MBY6242891.1 methyltransferase domain-containing protein [Methylosinus sp. Sm6]
MPEPTIFLPVAEAYDRWSRFYDSYDNPLIFGVDQVIGLLAQTVAGKDVIEFGCGTGRNLLQLKKHGAASLIGCDLSAGMLARARRDPELELLRHDIMQPLARPSASVDVVLFSLTLEHVADIAPPLREARRLLRPSGTILLIEIHPFMSMGNVGAHFRDGDDVVQMPTFPHAFSDYLNTAASVGLRVAKCREWRPRDFRGPLPAKVLKRGSDFPLLVEFSLRL